MQMIMYCEVLGEHGWQRTGNIFQSALMEELLTARVCDERNPILWQIFGRPEIDSVIEVIPGVQKTDECYMVYLTDVLNYNWEATVHKTGIISEWQYKRLKEQGISPTRIRKSVLNPETPVISIFDMDAILKDNDLRTTHKYYVNYQYDFRALCDICSFFYNVAMPKLMELVPDGKTECVRLVYDFVES